MPQMYHVLSRGVDKRKIFMDDKDYLRFVHDLFEFNDQQRAIDVSYHFNPRDVGRNEKKVRKLLVNVHAFCLMPNHYHLMISPRTENGLSLFMKKINGGYARYFNERHKRTGTLFERRYKHILLKSHAHFIHLPYYIHLNPLDLIAPEWRERKMKNIKKAIGFLNSYRWSSHLDYAGQKNFPSVTQREFLLEFFGGKKGYGSQIENWIGNLKIEKAKDFILE